MKDWLLPFLCGAGAGILSAWGIGGGTLLLLCMTLFLGVAQEEAQGINLLFFLPAAGASLLLHRKNGYLDSEVLRAAIPFGVPAAAIGALAASVVDLALLRKPFGVFLLYAGITLLFRKEKRERRSCA